MGTRGARRSKLQRLFSSFPDGAAGAGLLLLRAALGAVLVGQGTLSLGRDLASGWSRLGEGLSVLCGCALVAGVVTPGAAVLAAAQILARALAPPAAGAAPLAASALPWLVLVMAVTVALLGPGAFSVDARLFGRREIVVPRAPRGGPRDGG